MSFTTSNVLLNTLEKAGITLAFVNLGSDHPGILEAFIQRSEAQNHSIRFITSPNECVALNAAQGYFQVTGKLAAVIVHVDCGTQALAGAIHNVAVARIPVFIYAGASPFTQEGELPGSRNEFMNWMQDARDQPQILRQYVKHVAELRSGKNAQQVILRALQIANTEPKGPVYCFGAREVMEEPVDASALVKVDMRQWQPVDSAALSESTVNYIVSSLIKAESPLIVTSYLGRDTQAVLALTDLANDLAIPVFSSCPSTVNLSFESPMHAGSAFRGSNPIVSKADWILVLDSDIPWIPSLNKIREDAVIIHIDCDVLKGNMNLFYLPAQIRATANSLVALKQIREAVKVSRELFDEGVIGKRSEAMRLSQAHRRSVQSEMMAKLEGSQLPTVPLVMKALRGQTEEDALVLNEGISNYEVVWNCLSPTKPGSLITSGASALGWGLGASIGAGLAGQIDDAVKRDLTVLVIGDGSLIFGVPSAAFWMARRYETPFLTIVLNNGGWKSPKACLLGHYPNGPGSKASAADLNISFGPHPPDYGGIAAAAGNAWHRQVVNAAEVEEAIQEGVRVVIGEKRCAVLDVVLESI